MDRFGRGIDDDFSFVVCRFTIDESSDQSTAALVGRLHDCLLDGMTCTNRLHTEASLIFQVLESGRRWFHFCNA